MNTSLLRRFLADRAGVLLLLLANTLLIFTLMGLIRSYGDARWSPLATDLAYAALLSLLLLVIYLAVDLTRWWPFARQADELLHRSIGLQSLANLPPGATLDQTMARELLLKGYSLAVADLERLQEEHQRQLSFINLWVHQMKTPVSAISLIAQEADERLAADVLEETVKLNDGLELVLNMARLSDFAVDYHIRRTDLLASVRQVINSRKKQFIRAGIFPEIDAADGDWTVLTDDKWNRFVIDQIVANGLKYGAQSGKPNQRLKLSLVRQGQQVVLTIADQGPGIPAEDLPRVFEPFFTGENGRRFAQATGIGLYLVRLVVDRLDHRIAITSEEGVGTTVSLTYHDPYSQGDKSER